MSLDNPYPYEIVKVDDSSYRIDIKLENACKFLILYRLKRIREYPKKTNVDSWQIDWCITEPNSKLAAGHLQRDLNDLSGFQFQYHSLKFQNSMRIFSTLFNATAEFRDRFEPDYVHCFVVPEEKNKDKTARLHEHMIRRCFPATQYDISKRHTVRRADIFVRRKK